MKIDIFWNLYVKGRHFKSASTFWDLGVIGPQFGKSAPPLLIVVHCHSEQAKRFNDLDTST